MLRLEKMSIDDFNNYMEKSIAHYAGELVKSGAESKDSSFEASKKTFNRCLPDGIDTENHFIMNIINDKDEKIGIMWYGAKGKPDSVEAFIYDFSISEEFRGKGYGKKTLNLVEHEAKRQNFKKISLHVFGHNKRALNLYEKMGFEAYSIHMSKEIG